MHLLKAAAALAAFLPFSTAEPEPPNAGGPMTRFRLVISGDNIYKNQQVGAYRLRPPGGTYAPLIRNKGEDFAFNGSHIISYVGTFQYGLILNPPEDPRAQWASVTIGDLPGSPGYAIYFKNGHLENFNKKLGWKGWLICEWVHGGPELFYSVVHDPSIPSTCVKVDMDIK